MKRLLKALLFAFVTLLPGCKDDNNKNTITFGTSADSPPFEFVEDGGKLSGFDIELAELVAKKLEKKTEFKDMPFDSLATAVQNGSIDGIIASLNISEEKKMVLDFTKPYYPAKLSLIYKSESPVTSVEEIGNGKVACQLGANGHVATIKEKAPESEVIQVNTLNQAVESIKAGHADFAVMDQAPAIEFCKKNPGLNQVMVAKYEDGGYAIAFKKGSDLVEPVNKALTELENEGEIDRLTEKYIGK
jgi:polar amino acid transport system substrate-binding protein